MITKFIDFINEKKDYYDYWDEISDLFGCTELTPTDRGLECWASLRSAPTYELHKFYQSPRYRPWITASNALHQPAGGARMVR